MDSFELNKILGAVLGTCLFVLVSSFAASAIFTPKMPEKPGFEIAVKEDDAWRGRGSRRAVRADREAAADRLRREGRSRRQEVRRLPYLREGWPEPRRSESLWHRQRARGRGTRRLQFLGSHEGQGRHLDVRRPQQVHRQSEGFHPRHRDGLRRHPEGQRARRRDRLSATLADKPVPIPTAAK